LALKKREVTYTRPLSPTSVVVTIIVHPAVYTRSFEGPSEMSVDAREWVIQKSVLEEVSFPIPPKRGDRITDAELGTFAVDEVHPMYDLGGAVIGYRVRSG